MIALLTPEKEEDFLRACAYSPFFGARILTLLRAYGYGMRDAQFWLATGGNSVPTAAICRFDGWLDISAEEETADLGELAAFAAAVGELGYIETSRTVGEFLSRSIPGKFESSHIMRYMGGRPEGDFSAVDPSPPLAEVYRIIRAGSPFMKETTLWESWYPHVSHLVRHGLGFCCTVLEDGKPVSTGGVYTMGEECAVIASLSTLPEHRGRGHAALAVKHLVSRVLELGKTPILSAASDGLLPYYQKLGFVSVGRWGMLSVPGRSRQSKQV